MEKIYGYARVSSADQCEDRQLVKLAERGVSRENIYIDKVSGKDFHRPAYRAMVQKLRKDDLLYVLSIDRLGRNYEDIQVEWRRITKDIGADICVIDMPLLDTRSQKDFTGTFVADLTLQILSFVAESERRNIKERQAQGIAAAKIRGVKFGRPRIVEPEDFQETLRMWKNREISISVALARSGMSTSTFYRRAQKYFS